ncbi:uncharacterized protein STEHIDRAFT_150775 [Stereum hirsutum FP-91666 SS1]|uniref:Membrane insertase YidC/Oxa/ALB C-terminal domain-containing protein n=1 Tax=Stereum hirsutum (strain FP-91666) TaxID=721885 RepID=R7RXS6_STEHR|nr:uncharacterized protein STEHIDRAFT_150775 [Stereum hirsutum FP-91666 SS1]EIM80211.1 hypothetical protein STEHIDRAFT_150775 [Stereum hirsutum FP-91666 SS1]
MLGTTRILGHRAAPRLFVSPRARLISTLGTQRVRKLPVHGLVLTPITSRNIWGFSSSKPTPPPAAAPVPESVSQPTELEPVSSVAIDAVPPSESLSETLTSSSPITDPSILSDASSIDTLTSALTPLQHGDLAALGFSSWWPTGFCYWLYESLNVTFHLPWFWTIVAGTAVTRILILPLFITSQQNSARLAPHQPELLKLRDELTALSTGPNKDPLAVQRVAVKQKKLYEKANVNMFPMLAMPFVQLPLQLGLFFGTRNLCQAPLEQMKWSGLEMMPDLTAVDPYYILPIASALLMQVQLHFSQQDMSANRETMANMINFFRVASVAGIWFMGSLPIGVNLQVFTSIALIAAQNAVLRIPSVRKICGIAPRIVDANAKPVTFKESWVNVKKYIADQQRLAEEQAKGKKW